MRSWADRIGRRVKLRDLHILMAVAQWGSMVKAAKDLRISTPVVSKTIADLEHALGVALVDRHPHGIEPTLYGRALIKRSLVIFDELRQSVHDIGFLADPTTGHVRIGSTEPLAAGIACPPSSSGSTAGIREYRSTSCRRILTPRCANCGRARST